MRTIINLVSSKQALEGYLSLPPKERASVLNEVLITFAFVFTPAIGLAIFGFFGPWEYMEIALEIFIIASIAGLFAGMYLVAKIRQKKGEDSSAIMFVVGLFVLIFVFTFLSAVHWILDVLLAVLLVWLFYVYFKESADYSKYTREVQGKFIGYKLGSEYFQHPGDCHSAYVSPVLTPVFEVKRKKIVDYSGYHDSAHLDIESEDMSEESKAKNHQAYLEAADRFFAITHLEVGKTYTLKQHPIFRSKISYCMQFTQNRFQNSIDIYDDIILKIITEERVNH